MSSLDIWDFINDYKDSDISHITIKIRLFFFHVLSLYNFCSAIRSYICWYCESSCFYRVPCCFCLFFIKIIVFTITLAGLMSMQFLTFKKPKESHSIQTNTYITFDVTFPHNDRLNTDLSVKLLPQLTSFSHSHSPLSLRCRQRECSLFSSLLPLHFYFSSLSSPSFSIFFSTTSS